MRNDVVHGRHSWALSKGRHVPDGPLDSIFLAFKRLTRIFDAVEFSHETHVLLPPLHPVHPIEWL